MTPTSGAELVADRQGRYSLLSALRACDRRITELRSDLSAAEHQRTSIIADLFAQSDQLDSRLSRALTRIEAIATRLAQADQPTDIAHNSASVEATSSTAAGARTTTRDDHHIPLDKGEPSEQAHPASPPTAPADGDSQPAVLKPTLTLGGASAGAVGRLLEQVDRRGRFVHLNGHFTFDELQRRLPRGWFITEHADQEGAHLVYVSGTPRDAEDWWFRRGTTYLDALSAQGYGNRLDGSLLIIAMRTLSAIPMVPKAHLPHLEAHGTVRLRRGCGVRDVSQLFTEDPRSATIIAAWLKDTRAHGRDQRVVSLAHTWLTRATMKLPAPASPPGTPPVAPSEGHAVAPTPLDTERIREKRLASERAQALLESLSEADADADADADAGPIVAQDVLNASSQGTGEASGLTGPLRDLLSYLAQSDYHRLASVRARALAAGLVPLDAVREINDRTASSLTEDQQLLEISGDDLWVDTDAAKEVLGS
ncbi:hypothetical protein [Kineococcus sp. SYSU DK004]|uniref:hypothetical protein n=1 Tax=Kineococcus sp. SYSU DK004 TaxID=3383125 RepID=UPI003D7D9CBD